mmetsp:Transcript_145184/g.465186  ORF Transcript_145184/g.465186 Transcript_145184/m.465186 type:complete len:242 (+) Transcript_145184:710-1435(+)
MRNCNGRCIRVAVKIAKEGGQKLHHELHEIQVALNGGIEHMDGELASLGHAEQSEKWEVILPKETLSTRNVPHVHHWNPHRCDHVRAEETCQQDKSITGPTAMFFHQRNLLVDKLALHHRIGGINIGSPNGYFLLLLLLQQPLLLLLLLLLLARMRKARHVKGHHELLLVCHHKLSAEIHHNLSVPEDALAPGNPQTAVREPGALQFAPTELQLSDFDLTTFFVHCCCTERSDGGEPTAEY